MAFSTKSNYGLGNVVCVPQVTSEFNKFANDSEPKHILGFKVEDVDGSVYRYAQFGASTGPSKLVSTDISESFSFGGDSDNICAVAAISTKEVTLTYGGAATAEQVAANQFAGAKFIVTDDTGEGYIYDVVGNTANATNAGTIIITLKQPLQVALDTTSDVMLIGNRYSNLEGATATADSAYVGVSCGNMTANYFGWVQTKGVCSILQSGTVVKGASITGSDTAGAVEITQVPSATNGGLDPVVGFCLLDGDTTGYGAFYIDLD